ncbi:MAG: DivIVA domain-containing protein [Calditrichaeota bacterium]|nr:MAG: DivIVA domain-containing protein [Calditrichota bacterium]MBL1204411.1 DivIVA domain-containing protein [Calditrichota bacterium]NOG44240.1 DivIVA domain-containing protein [Calditrichota bacterium]
MKLTPVEIKNQEFKKTMRGYDTVEVDTFIELVADKYQQLLEENEKIVKQNLVLETEMANFKDVEKTLKQTLKNVQENSQISKENSAKEANLIKKEAELASAQMLEKTRLKVHQMREELVNLQNQKHSLISRLKHLLSSQMELLEVLEIDDVDLKKIKKRTVPAAAESAKPVVQKREPLKMDPKVVEKQKPQSPEIKENKEKTHGKDLFNDIFGENLDVDDFNK